MTQMTPDLFDTVLNALARTILELQRENAALKVRLAQAPQAAQVDWERLDGGD